MDPGHSFDRFVDSFNRKKLRHGQVVPPSSCGLIEASHRCGSTCQISYGSQAGEHCRLGPPLLHPWYRSHQRRQRHAAETRLRPLVAWPTWLAQWPGGVGTVRGRPGQRPGAAGCGLGGATRPPDPDFRPKQRHRHGARCIASPKPLPQLARRLVCTMLSLARHLTTPGSSRRGRHVAPKITEFRVWP